MSALRGPTFRRRLVTSLLRSKARGSRNCGERSPQAFVRGGKSEAPRALVLPGFPSFSSFRLTRTRHMSKNSNAAKRAFFLPCPFFTPPPASLRDPRPRIDPAVASSFSPTIQILAFPALPHRSSTSRNAGPPNPNPSPNHRSSNHDVVLPQPVSCVEPLERFTSFHNPHREASAPEYQILAFCQSHLPPLPVCSHLRRPRPMTRSPRTCNGQLQGKTRHAVAY